MSELLKVTLDVYDICSKPSNAIHGLKILQIHGYPLKRKLSISIYFWDQP